ncbi:Protein of unknown function [Mesorhizobium albiziae]|uniref:DUF1353 domain-containing protein n=1 Tax=Neomesorhizobium albiziae TaxID=335020 RepID=A0A1I4E8N7_9HYPH|nr:DUF1353 domain-containing protein [Mesorhizobium albiziae]GLS33871.1 hypothetical protein GCM10007937_55840 [Mesorhizobium albiziae]SFL00967.1 Protein of unknown function [Mesorhizobium albiziae]
MRFAIMILLGSTVSGAVNLLAAEAHAGSFTGDFEFRWLNEPTNQHRIMRSLGENSFKDDDGKVWLVPKGTKIDGASIPPVLWTFAGSPFTGNYRRASVVHDFYCDTDTEFRSAIHKMFRDAMAADGISGWELASKYAAVSVFGSGCGKPDNLLGALFSGTIEGFAPTDELKANLQQLSEGTDLGTVADRTETVTAIAQVQKPQTFMALAEFRRVPSESNFQELQNAIQSEQPSDTELDSLILLTGATVPEGSAPLPIP